MLTGPMLLVVFLIAILILLVSIIRYHLNPFLALLITSIVTAFLVGMPIGKISSTLSSGFGGTLAGIGIVIGLGIIFGQILSEAGATTAIADGLLKRTGVKHAALAVTAAGFLISIPVYMDAAFVIMMPIVKYVADVTKRSLKIFVCALGVGTIVGHALVIPTPGPLVVANNMSANVAAFILYSLIAGAAAIVVGGWLYGKVFEGDKPEEIADAPNDNPIDDFKGPSFGLSLFCLTFPILLILIANILLVSLEKDSLAHGIFTFVGDKNLALLFGVIAAYYLLRKHVAKPFTQIIIEAADSSGLILLITGAGGAFGSIINASGIGQYLVDSMSDLNIPIVVLGFVLSAVLRLSQGSTTVALVTTSSILGPSIAGTGASPVLVGLAICAGGIGLSMPNDSGFWVLSRFSGLSVQDTLKTWTAGGTIAGFTAFIVILLLHALYSSIGLPLL
ncbi:MAG: GntP family permease [Desulfovibrio sp.]|nr:GntP family permease [Desulfovibrio sp.]